MTPHSIERYYETLRALTASIRVTDKSGCMRSLQQGVDSAIALIMAGQTHAGTLMFIGNGASASISSHMAADFLKNGQLRALCFNDSALLTCMGNDCGYENVFKNPIERMAKSSDVLIAISSSGKSRNILEAVQAAKRKQCTVITLSGFAPDNPLSRAGDINFYVPAHAYSHVEIMHHSICHYTLDELIQRRTTNDKKSSSNRRGRIRRVSTRS